MAVQNARRTRVVIDTSVLIDLIKSGKLIQFAEKYDGCITSVTLYEYLRGELYLGRNISEIKNFLEKIFDILYMDNDAIRKACELWLSLAKKGKLISEPDIWISAIYITKNLPLVTTNIRHFKRLKEYGLKILSVKFQTENNSIP